MGYLTKKLNLQLLDKKKMDEKKGKIYQLKEKRLKEEHEKISDLEEKKKKLFHAAREKGASSWLSALPIQRLGYTINKQEFRNAVCLRYRWRITDMPKFCACGQSNSLD